MQEFGTLETISELAITLTGFTGIVVVFGPERLNQPAEQLRLRSLLYWSLGTAFLAHLPGLLLAFPSPLPIWRISHAVFAAFHLSVFIWFFAGIRRLRQANDLQTGTVQMAMRVIISTGVVVLACELAVAFGLAPGFGNFFYLLALLWFLFLAAFSFATLLLPAAAQDAVTMDQSTNRAN